MATKRLWKSYSTARLRGDYGFKEDMSRVGRIGSSMMGVAYRKDEWMNCCWWNGRCDEVDALLARHGYTTMVSELQHSLKEADRIGEMVSDCWFPHPPKRRVVLIIIASQRPSDIMM